MSYFKVLSSLPRKYIFFKFTAVTGSMIERTVASLSSEFFTFFKWQSQRKTWYSMCSFEGWDDNMEIHLFEHILRPSSCNMKSGMKWKKYKVCYVERCPQQLEVCGLLGVLLIMICLWSELLNSSDFFPHT